MKKETVSRLFAKFVRLPLRGKLIASATALAVANCAATFVLYIALGGSASGGKIEAGHYFIRQKAMPPFLSGNTIYLSYAEVSRAAFTLSRVTEYLAVASLVVAVLYVGFAYFKEERALKAKRATISDAVTVEKEAF